MLASDYIWPLTVNEVRDFFTLMVRTDFKQLSKHNKDWLTKQINGTMERFLGQHLTDKLFQEAQAALMLAIGRINFTSTELHIYEHKLSRDSDSLNLYVGVEQRAVTFRNIAKLPHILIQELRHDIAKRTPQQENPQMGHTH